jgi:crotonobetainyl-CoA:carnitine CoA-transferase CaiB-like acyl-CoA transferase
MRQLLSDLIAVELAEGMAGDYCGKVFADLGADVIKVERPGGDRLRAQPGAFAHLNLNKRAIVADPSSPADVDRLWRLLQRADLVIETTDGGNLADFGTDGPAVAERFPGLVVASISGFGATGPYSSYQWTDLVVQSFAGALVAVGADEPPVKLPANTELCAVGHTAAVGALAAVLRSRATGAGAVVDCAAYEALGGNPNRILRHLAYEYRGREPLPKESTGTAAAGTGTLLPLGIFPCADGYVSMMTTPQNLPRMLRVLGDDALAHTFSRPGAFMDPQTKEALDAVLYPWLLSHTRAEIVEAAQSGGWPVTGVNLPAEIIEAQHLHQRGFWVHVDDPAVGPVLVPGPLSRHDEGGWQLRRPAPSLGQDRAGVDAELAIPVRFRPEPAGPATASDPPLQGLRVLDLTTVWSGPYVTLLLADLGAEVIRVESPWVFPPSAKGFEPRPHTKMILGSIMHTYGPLAEGRPDRPYNRHAMNNSVNRGKLSCTLDVRSTAARDLFLHLVEKSDVVIENFKLPALHQMGIWESELLHRNPGLLLVQLPPAGLSGDWSGYIGFGAQFDALAGITALVGRAGSEIAEAPSTFHMDTVTGPAGAFAILAALHYRSAMKRGQRVELAQSENLLHQLGDVFVDCQLGVEVGRIGNRDPFYAPQGLYPCLDDHWLAVSVRDEEEWAALCRVMGKPELARDGRYATAADRASAHDELDKLIAAWTATLDPYELFHLLQCAGIPSAPVLDDLMTVTDPHIATREWLRPLSNRDVGSFDHIGPVFRGIPLAWHRGAPVLGEHNDYVFREVLRLTDTEYEQLVADQIAVEDYLGPDGRPL